MALQRHREDVASKSRLYLTPNTEPNLFVAQYSLRFVSSWMLVPSQVTKRSIIYGRLSTTTSTWEVAVAKFTL
jgi:hypothetical protein